MHPFIYNNKIRKADVVVVPKSEFNLVAHYAVYLGFNQFGEEIMSENKHGYGVRILTTNQFFQENPSYKRLRLFNGNDYQRMQAVNRAISLIGRKYDLINFNCEHYANYVQTNQSVSNQIKWGAGVSALAVLALILFAARN